MSRGDRDIYFHADRAASQREIERNCYECEARAQSGLEEPCYRHRDREDEHGDSGKDAEFEAMERYDRSKDHGDPE